MDQAIKQRLTGAIVLVSLAIIVLPLLLDGDGVSELPVEVFDLPESQLDSPVDDTPSHDPTGEGLREDLFKPEDVETSAPFGRPTPPPKPAKAPEAPEAPKSAEEPEAVEETKPAESTPPPKPVEPAKDEPPPASEPPPAVNTQPVRKWRVLLATFATPTAAQRFVRQLKEGGYDAIVKAERNASGKRFHIVVLPMEGRYDDIDRRVKELSARYPGVKRPIIRRR